MKRMPNMVHAGTYSAVLQYLKAVQAAGSDDSDAVMAALKKARSTTRSPRTATSAPTAADMATCT